MQKTEQRLHTIFIEPSFLFNVWSSHEFQLYPSINWIGLIALWLEILGAYVCLIVKSKTRCTRSTEVYANMLAYERYAHQTKGYGHNKHNTYIVFLFPVFVALTFKYNWLIGQEMKRSRIMPAPNQFRSYFICIFCVIQVDSE